MIFNSLFYRYVVTAASGNTRDAVLIDCDFTSLYQINPDHLIVLGYAAVSGQRQQDNGFNINSSEAFACRLIGAFNESHNVGFSIVTPRAGDSVVNFSGITFGSNYPFVAPDNARILMPPSFQLEFIPSSLDQTTDGDTLDLFFTIGYEITKRTFKAFNQ